MLLSAWLVTRWEGTPANLAPDEHLDIGWFALAQLHLLAYHLVRERLVRAARSGSTARLGAQPSRDAGVELGRLGDAELHVDAEEAVRVDDRARG